MELMCNGHFPDELIKPSFVDGDCHTAGLPEARAC